MRRSSLILCLVTCLALCVCGIRSANATLFRVDFNVRILEAQDGNPFGVPASDPYYTGFAIYDSSDIDEDGTIRIGGKPDSRLSVTVGNRTFVEREDIDYQTEPGGLYPELFFLGDQLYGIRFAVEFDWGGYEDLFFLAMYYSDIGPGSPDFCDFNIYLPDSDDYLIRGDFTDFSAPTPIPEPATMLLLGTGLAGLAGLRRKLKKV